MRGKHLAARRWVVASGLGIALAVVFPVIGFADGPPIVGGGVETSDVPAAATMTGQATSINARTATHLTSPARPADAAVNRPTISFKEYRQMKARAAAVPGTA
jgi:hypothetical protein